MAPDLFPDFTRQFIKPLTKFPSSFHPITSSLLTHYSIVLMDLRGYGASSVVPSTNGSGYSKRLMTQDCVFVLAQLGYDKFTLVGHDRGARVAYCLAFDQPQKIVKVTKKRNLADFSEVALDGYSDAYCDDERIHSTCEDYWAGAFLDRVYDEEGLKLGKKIETPMLAVWGSTGLFAEPMATKAEGSLEIWKKCARDVRGKGLECGHFVVEEDPGGLTDALLPFLPEK
ncbi:hypothetical protein ACJZ2D_004543 [Fusarium nematophilum]